MRSFSALLVLAVMGAGLGSSGCSSGDKFPVRTYSLGERVPLGHLIYTVFERKWLTQLGEGTDARVPQHRFYLVRLSAVNSGSSDLMVPGFTLVDDKNASYAELSNGEGVPQWIGTLRSVKPAEAAQGNVLFDCPAQHYKLRITDENEEHAALIDLPLTFDTDVPELFSPGQKPVAPIK